MNKTALIYDVSRKLDLPFTKAEQVVNDFLANIARALSNGERVTITGFGTFEVRKRKARIGRVPPHTGGQQVHIPEHLTAAFIAGNWLKRVVQGKERI